MYVLQFTLQVLQRDDKKRSVKIKSCLLSCASNEILSGIKSDRRGRKVILASIIY